ncbi:MAG: hypothetical protein JWM53_1391 [bacterium]|nr:hypothetical protein [bacterium]
MRRTLVVMALLAGCAHETHKAPPAGENKEEAEGEKGTAPPTEQPTTMQTPSGVQVGPTTNPLGPPAKPLPPKIKIIVRAKGPDKATVFWGKKKLGDTPVTLERPRDSGPVDLVVRGEGFFPVHTRAYTFRNDVIYVKMTKLDDRMTLFGAKRDATEPPPGGVPDGGVPPPQSPAAPAP